MNHPPDTQPFEPPPTDASDPRFAEHQAMLKESQENWRYFIEHESEMFQQHPDSIAVVYSGNQVRYCDDSQALVSFLETLDPVRRDAAQLCTPMSADAAWVL